MLVTSAATAEGARGFIGGRAKINELGSRFDWFRFVADGPWSNCQLEEL
jgi:hypothetical protein